MAPTSVDGSRIDLRNTITFAATKPTAMPSLFEQQTANEILQRINNLQPNSQRQWGKMSAAQMMAHVNFVLQLATGDKTEKPTFMMKLMGPMIKKVIMSPKPFKQSLPTGPNFVMKEEKDFSMEKQSLINTYNKFIQGGTATAEGKKHPIMGKLTAEEWGYSQWKHFDHHLKQFGV
jgi:hypothetical protein